MLIASAKGGKNKDRPGVNVTNRAAGASDDRTCLGVNLFCRTVRIYRRQRAMLDALRGEKLDLDFLMLHITGVLGSHDQGLRSIGNIKRALKSLRLHSALLAGIFLERGLQHFRFPMQLVSDRR